MKPGHSLLNVPGFFCIGRPSARYNAQGATYLLADLLRRAALFE
jgi:hypothetical protein